MLRIYFLRHWFNLSDPAAEEALYDSPALRRFARVDLDRAPAPDETTILNFCHLLARHDRCCTMLDAVNPYLEDHGIRTGKCAIVDATILHAPSSTKNAAGMRNPETHQTRKGSQWFFEMKAHIGVDSKEGHLHTYRVNHDPQWQMTIDKAISTANKSIGHDSTLYQNSVRLKRELVKGQ